MAAIMTVLMIMISEGHIKMAKILDQYGNPVQKSALSTPQSDAITALQNNFYHGGAALAQKLSPQRINAVLQQADMGNFIEQHLLFAEMEERDAHLVAEMNKRKLAVSGLDCDIVPPVNASADENKLAEFTRELLSSAIDPMEDLILALMDGVGHGFAAIEFEWSRINGLILPQFHPRPQTWFRLDRTGRKITLRDDSTDGADLQPFGWMLHTHGKAKTGYIGRMGLHRTLIWPFLYKHYAVADFAELLDAFGLPMLLGKYEDGVSEDLKREMWQSLVTLGHSAKAIMPVEMQLEIKEATGGGGGLKPIHLSMVDWAERSMSKAIVGQTMSAEAKSSGLGSGNADLHEKVRQDILLADARQISETITRDLIFPLLVINRNFGGGLRRCPKLVFDTSESKDLAIYANAIPRLVQAGVEIPETWVRGQLKIPTAAKGEKILKMTSALPSSPASDANGDKTALTAQNRNLNALSGAVDQLDAADHLTGPALAQIQPIIDNWLNVIEENLTQSASLEEFRDNLAGLYPHLPDDALAAIMASAFTAAHVRGAAEIDDEVTKAKAGQ